jgi:hypothetical protein
MKVRQWHVVLDQFEESLWLNIFSKFWLSDNSLSGVHFSSATCYRSWYCRKVVHKRTRS